MIITREIRTKDNTKIINKNKRKSIKAICKSIAIKIVELKAKIAKNIVL